MDSKTVQKHIVVTKCPHEPCTILYADIFGILNVICKNPIHKENSGLVTNQDHKQDEDPTTTKARVLL